MKSLLKYLYVFLFIFLTITKGETMENPKILMKLKYGEVKIELFKDQAPNHVNRILDLVNEGAYNNVVFHRVIAGFMAQTGDVKNGNKKSNYNPQLVGTGGASKPDLKAEFNNLPHVRGTLSMARSQNPNSANSQFFICFDKHPHLDRNYTVFGKVLSGMEFVDKIKKGEPGSGSVDDPDIIESITVIK
jgi:cyclophilin family peptidyl-prolyl cis-trans isomerase